MPPRRIKDSDANIQTLLAPYNPWWGDTLFPTTPPPAFRRPVFARIHADLHGIKQVISITGPRRVGKTTLVRQLVEELLHEGVDPARIVYFSMDDPLLYREPYRERFFDLLVGWLGAKPRHEGEPHFVFLDEIQRYDRWELFLKKYYDLGYPLRFVISGSASSPIFKKSRESLLGRVKDFHVLPFSFREYVLYHRREDPLVLAYLDSAAREGAAFRDSLETDEPNMAKVLLPSTPTARLDESFRALLGDYFVEGGFPETWEILDLVRKQEYLYDNQVQKVIFEDLVLATEFRKPENIKAFYLSLIEQPGRELSLERAAEELGVSRPMLEKYFPLLEMTDLVKRLPQFSKRVLKVRRGNVKCYLVDLALRNAVLKLGRRVLDDSVTLGQYAENIVFNTLSRWPGVVSLSYYRDRGRGGKETDFVVTLGGGRYLGIEVKYRRTLDDLGGLHYFLEQFPKSFGLVVSMNAQEFREERIACVPLHLFLLGMAQE